MSDTDFDPEDYDGIVEKMATVPRKQIRLWEKQARELAEQKAILDQLQRERSFVKAGIPETGLGKLFVKGYDGPDDVDAIKAAAIEYGIMQPTGGQDQVDESLRGHEAAMAAASGASTPDPRVDLMSRMKAAKNPQELAQIMDEAGIAPQSLQGFPELRR